MLYFVVRKCTGMCLIGGAGKARCKLLWNLVQDRNLNIDELTGIDSQKWMLHDVIYRMWRTAVVVIFSLYSVMLL